MRCNELEEGKASPGAGLGLELGELCSAVEAWLMLDDISVYVWYGMYVYIYICMHV